MSTRTFFWAVRELLHVGDAERIELLHRVVAKPAAKDVFRADGPRNDASRRRGLVLRLIGERQLDGFAKVGPHSGRIALVRQRNESPSALWIQQVGHAHRARRPICDDVRSPLPVGIAPQHANGHVRPRPNHTAGGLSRRPTALVVDPIVHSQPRRLIDGDLHPLEELGREIVDIHRGVHRNGTELVRHRHHANAPRFVPAMSASCRRSTSGVGGPFRVPKVGRPEQILRLEHDARRSLGRDEIRTAGESPFSAARTAPGLPTDTIRTVSISGLHGEPVPLLLSARVAEIVEMPVFGADHDVRNAVVVEIDHGRTGRVSRESPRIERSAILEMPFAVATFRLAQPSHVGAIGENPACRRRRNQQRRAFADRLRRPSWR